MIHQQSLDEAPEPEPTPSREALRLIIEVFRDGHRAAADLRVTADELTAVQLEHELATIEEDMLTQISCICAHYERPGAGITRH